MDDRPRLGKRVPAWRSDDTGPGPVIPAIKYLGGEDMLDRFKDAQWIHGVPPTGTVRHETGVYGTLACGHLTIVAECGGHSCNSETLREDQKANARLIAASPDLLAAAKAALDRLCDPYLGEDDGERQRPEIAALEQAIAKVEGPDGGYARLLDTDPKFEAWVRGCVDKAEGRA